MSPAQIGNVFRAEDLPLHVLVTQAVVALYLDATTPRSRVIQWMVEQLSGRIHSPPEIKAAVKVLPGMRLTETSGNGPKCRFTVSLCKEPYGFTGFSDECQDPIPEALWPSVRDRLVTGAWRRSEISWLQVFYIADYLRSSGGDLSKLSLGTALAVVHQSYAVRMFLGKRGAHLVPYAESDHCERAKNAEKGRPSGVAVGERYVHTWELLRQCLRKLLQEHGGQLRTSQIKGYFRELFAAELSETAFCCVCLSELLEEMLRMPGEAMFRMSSAESKGEAILQLSSLEAERCSVQRLTSCMAVQSLSLVPEIPGTPGTPGTPPRSSSRLPLEAADLWKRSPVGFNRRSHAQLERDLLGGCAEAPSPIAVTPQRPARKCPALHLEAALTPPEPLRTRRADAAAGLGCLTPPRTSLRLCDVLEAPLAPLAPSASEFSGRAPGSFGHWSWAPQELPAVFEWSSEGTQPRHAYEARLPNLPPLPGSGVTAKTPEGYFCGSTTGFGDSSCIEGWTEEHVTQSFKENHEAAVTVADWLLAPTEQLPRCGDRQDFRDERKDVQRPLARATPLPPWCEVRRTFIEVPSNVYAASIARAQSLPPLRWLDSALSDSTP